ncbi:MAG TPA: hypothetical protein VGF22_22045 [Acidimicrobiales bacterium]|jgi:hypothetical protein
MTTAIQTDRPRATVGELVYRFEGTLAEMYPIGVFAEGIRFHNHFEGTVVAGPFAGAKIFGPDLFLLRPDGVGEIHAPEVIDDGTHRVALDVRGYVVPPPGAPVPPLEALLAPGFEFPDVPFRVTGSALATTAAPGYEYLNRATIVIEGHVNLSNGELVVEARAVERIPDGSS